MAVSHGLRQFNKPGSRLRRRRDSEEDNIYLDLNKDPSKVIQEILFNVVNREINVAKKLGYLNGLVKLSLKQPKEYGIPYRDIFCCLRVPLFHEACEVRAAGLRACRYMIENVDILEAFLQTNTQFLVSRSLDISLDNRIERVQALRLIRKVLDLSPSKFPCAFSKCIVAVANEGSQERDMIRPCLATLAQFALLNPPAFIEAKGVHALLKNVIENLQVQTSEALLGVIYFLINKPATRNLMKEDFGLETLLAPFTDCHYRFPTTLDGLASEDKDPNLNASKAAIACALRSWPGLIYLCKSDSCHMQYVVEMLYLPYPDLRKNIVDLLFQIFEVSVPEWTNDFSIALSSCDPSSSKPSWQLYEGYIVAEGLDVLPYSSKDRPNLVQNYYALLLLVFMNCGLIEALSDVIITGEINLAVRATIFLGELIYMANQFLPTDCSHLSNCLPTLMASASSFECSKKQNQSSASLTCLHRMHELKKRGTVPYSLTLNHILYVCNPDQKKKGLFGAINKIKLWKYLKQEMADNIDHAIKDTQVLNQEFSCWDWDLIGCILKNPSDSLKKLDDTNHRAFIKRLLFFYKPNNKQFSELEYDKENGRQICITGCHLLEFFLELEEAKAEECLDEFLGDLNSCFIQLTKDGERLNSVLSPIKVSTTLSQMYFLFIGKLSSTNKGCKFLNRCSTFQNLLHLVSNSNQDVYLKLIVSNLDYTKEGFSRSILTKVLTGTEESTRLYATNFLHVLLRAKLPDYRKWAIEVLLYQLHDVSKLVSNAALDILDEACTIEENLEALISFRPSLLQLGDKGLLLLIRYLSVQSGFNFLKESNFLYCELERWRQVYNFKYVKLIEDMINEAFTHHKRNKSGTYGRRSSDMSFSVQNVYLPPHMYGQLIQHLEGLRMLEKEDVFSELYANIKSHKFDDDSEILSLKASLWALGHIGSYPLGARVVIDNNIIPAIVDLAATASVMSIRGTSYFVLGLISSTPEGVEALKECGWESIQRNHEEKWPLIKDEVLVESEQYVRKSTWSFSSMSSEWPLGALPTNLSFIVRTPGLDLLRSRSDHSNDSGEDILQNSCLELPSQEELSSGDTCRQRSSSDCQSNWKDNGLCQTHQTNSWDTLNTYSLPPATSLNKRRSICTDVERKVFDLCDEVNEDDLPEASVENSALLPQSRPSSRDSSISSFKSSNASLERPSLLKQLSRGHSVYLKSPVSPDQPPPQSSFILTSARDALGYATLKDIQRRRVNSLSFHDPSMNQTDLSMRYIKSQSLDADTAKIFNVSQNDLLFPDLDDDMVKAKSSSQYPEIVVPEKRFIGLCLPSSLELLLNVPKQPDDSYSLDSSALQVSPKSDDFNFEYHSEENCIANHNFIDKRCVQGTTIDEESEEHGTGQENPIKRNVCKMFTPVDRSNSIKGLIKPRDDAVYNQQLIRKEAMRFVISLCSSVASRVSQAEQGLLNLKQKFPNAFQDICLYTEISFYMANYNFRLNARRFLQELFLDVVFEQLHLEAEAIVGIGGSISQIGGNET